MRLLLLVVLCALSARCGAQESRRVGRLQEVFAWKQVTYNIEGNQVLTDRFSDVEEEANSTRVARQAGFDGNFVPPSRWNPIPDNRANNRRSWRPANTRNRPFTTPPPTTTDTNSNDESRQFFIQYNNLPMGVERAGNRLFITIPRRRYGIPSTLNYLDLTQDSHTRSPGLRPYPNLSVARTMVSVYRTRADHCNRLWMVDNGMLELPNNRQQLQQPAVVVFDLSTDRQILRYPLKSTDIITANTPAGLASITLDFPHGNDCSNVFAYIPDLATYGLIVYSLRDNDSWRLTHNYFNFNPVHGNLRLSGQYFQWNDGIFSITLTEPDQATCRTAYFHPMISNTEFAVSTCVLRNRTASQDDNFWQRFSVVGDRGANSQCTMHGYYAPTSTVLFADIGRDALSCWNTGSVLEPANVAILVQDSLRLSYPSDLHVTGDEVWLMANNLPTWAYGRLNTNEYNFFIYRANIEELISGTVCSPTAGGVRRQRPYNAAFTPVGVPFKDEEETEEQVNTTTEKKQ